MQHSISTWQPRQWFAVIAGFCILIALVLATNTTGRLSAQNPNERVVTVYDGESELTFVTTATTVKQALEKSGTAIGTSDAVEPGLDTPLIASNYHLNVYRARPVLVIDGEKRETVLSPYKSAKQIAEKAGLGLHAEDTATVERVDDVLSDGAAAQKIVIDRAVPLKLDLYGMPSEIRTQAGTVGELLKEKGVELGPQDGTSYPTGQHIVAGMTLSVWRDGKQTTTEEQAIQFPIRQIKDKDREIGYKEVKTPGKPGKKMVTFEVEMKSGKIISRKEVQSVVIVQPVEQVEVVGAKPKGAYTTPSENEKIAWNFFIAQGFTREQTAGIMGNLKQESGFKTGGDGIAQWTGGRKAALLSRPDPYNIQTQLEFLMYELNTGYSRVKNNLRASQTVDQSVIVFQNQYERCGICMQSKRIQYAYDILASH